MVTQPPDFNSHQKLRFEELGLCNEQIVELRRTVQIIRQLVLAKKPRKNGTKEILKEIQKHSTKLQLKLNALLTMSDPEHSLAHSMIEERYWRPERRDDSGPTVTDHLSPRLGALKEAAASAISAISSNPTRHKSADHRPIGWINEALVWGWDKAHGTRVRSSKGILTIEEMMMPDESGKRRPRVYPESLFPSARENSSFREIVALCYEAAGQCSEPEQALKRYMREERKDWAAIEKAMFDGSDPSSIDEAT